MKEEQRRASLTSPAAMSDGEAVLLLQSLTEATVSACRSHPASIIVYS